MCRPRPAWSPFPLLPGFICLLLLATPHLRAEDAPVAQWVTPAGGVIPDSAAAVAVDAAGNVYFTGWFGSTATFGNTVLTATGGYDLYLAKLPASAPQLFSVPAGNGLTLSWLIDSGDWVIETSPVLGIPFGPLNYIPVTNSLEGRVEVTLPASGTAAFFILRKL